MHQRRIANRPLYGGGERLAERHGIVVLEAANRDAGEAAGVDQAAMAERSARLAR